MSSNQVISIRIVCDKTAAHKSGKAQRIGTIILTDPGHWSFKKPIKKSAVKITHETELHRNPHAPDEFRQIKRLLVELRCPTDKCKHREIRFRPHLATAAFEAAIAANIDTISLDQLGVILSRQVGNSTSD